jgi:hypothetical protein
MVKKREPVERDKKTESYACKSTWSLQNPCLQTTPTVAVAVAANVLLHTIYGQLSALKRVLVATYFPSVMCAS